MYVQAYREETVIRSLIREMLITEKDGFGGLEALGAEIENALDTALDKVDDQGEKKNEAVAMLAAGIFFSMPTIIKLSSKAVAYGINSLALLAEKLWGESERSENMSDWAKKVKEKGAEWSESFHNVFLNVYAGILKTLYYSLCWTFDRDNFDQRRAWAESAEGEALFKKVAKFVDLGVTLLLFYFSVTGAAHAIKDALVVLGGVEGVLSGVKVTHLSHVVPEIVHLLTGGAEEFAKLLAAAGIAGAALAKMVTASKPLWAALVTVLKAGAEKVKQAVSDVGIPAETVTAQGPNMSTEGVRRHRVKQQESRSRRRR